ncbi:MAG: glycosyltransferase [Nitrospiraceae bacterium]|nr:glycosyltransferase [Nitrospiraceae bacterium]
MKILHVYKDFDPPVRGGMERHIALMCRYQRQWAEIEALTCSRCPRTQVMTRDGARVTEVGEWGRFQGAPVAPLFPYYLRRARADVVVVHVPNPTAELGYLLARPKGKLIVRYHSDVVRQAAAMRFYAPLQEHFLRKAVMILPTSEQYVQTSSTLQSVLQATPLGEREGKIRVVPLGIVTEEFAKPDEARVTALREQYGGDYVLFSGMHRYYKGLEYLVRAAKDIRAPVVIAGEGPESKSVQALARELDVPVKFPGALSQEDLVAHLHGCAVFAFPSVARSEAFGISILEAQACGKPVVATKLGTGTEYANLDGQTGYNVPPRDPEAFARAVNYLLDDAPLRTRLGEFARRRVETEFHAERAARQAFELYLEALK